jgi:primosomal protein N' (replication factor Y)
MEDCFSKGKQVILFINRRGYSSFVSCRECGYTLKCPDCGIAMTYHKDRNACVCHYCGRTAPVPPVCPECGSRIIGRFGAGTQQIEEKAKELFPGRTVARLDLDTVSRKGTLEKVLDKFKAGKIDILIGTQIIAKGHDFPNVGLVGIVSADVSLNIPDFRSAERTFQLLTQAAGRAGRGDDPGEVVIQTYSPDHPALRAAARHDYAAFYEGEIAVRKAVSYPPYSDIFQIVVSGEDERAAERDAERWADRLRSASGGAFSVLGPAISPINKQSGKYRYQVLVKSPGGMRREVSRLIIDLKKRYEESRGTQLVTSDVNPYSFM